MKRGDNVAVCYDGKYGRKVRGVVTKTHNGHHVTVEFVPWADGKGLVSVKFRRSHNNWRPQRVYYSGYLRSDDSLMTAMMGLAGDYYAVYKWAKD